MSKKNRSKKEAFTIRLQPETIENLDIVGEQMGLKTSTVARKYLQISKYMVITSDQQLQTYDKTGLTAIPKNILQLIFSNLSEDKQFEIGDSLGVVLNTNATLLKKKTIKEKLELIQGLGWLEIRKLGHRWAFSAREFPIGIINALVYRILHNRKYPTMWKRDYISPNLSKSTDQLKDLAKDYRKSDNDLKHIDREIPKFDRELGGSIENYSPVCRYYTFSTLKIEGEKE